MSLAKSCAVLAVAVVPAAVAIAFLCFRGLSASAVFTALVASGVCWVAGSLALTAAFAGNLLEMPVQGVLGGMLFRMGLPLVAVAGLNQAGGELATTAVTMTILGVYLVALVVETLLSLRLVADLNVSEQPDAVAKA